MAQTQPAATEDVVFLGIRVLKVPQAGELKWSVDLPANCPKCRLEMNKFTTAQNTKEFFFHFWAPQGRETIGSVHIKVDPAKVRRVLVGLTDLGLNKELVEDDKGKQATDGMMSIPFRRTDDGITLDVPAHPHGLRMPPDDSGDVTNAYTYIETPGVYVRVGHADEQRRRDGYASVWPAVEAQAALNLEFAAREAIENLDLVPALQKRGVQTITLMNFDTNAPTQGPFAAHDDYSPHWHMHLYWGSNPRVRKVGHFMIGPNGLIDHNVSQVVQTPDAYPWVLRGEADETKTPDGEVLFTHTVTPEGFFVLSTPTGACRFTPVAGGFHTGVNLACDKGRPLLRVRAEDNPDTGVLRVFLDDVLRQEYHYDPDTSALTSSRTWP